MVDGVVLVIASGLAPRRQLTWVKHLLDESGARVCGAVINFAPRSETGSYYYYYYYGGRTRKHLEEER
jgi:Mrp family chromosome partitioning ATPase